MRSIQQVDISTESQLLGFWKRLRGKVYWQTELVSPAHLESPASNLQHAVKKTHMGTMETQQ